LHWYFGHQKDDAQIGLQCRDGLARDDSGASAAEFALIVPVLLLILFSIIQFGITINNYIQITSGARAGARTLAISRGSATPYQDSVTAFRNSAPNISPTMTLSVNGTACSSNGACQPLLAAAAGQPAVFRATLPCNLQVMGFDFAPGCQLVSQTTERVE
jgi:Flp pilus assembly protein TadG